ncbi:MAG TPA: UDP-N-acetylglucosamine--N-acetylmuramyl-(pentapeptide) pyrophosphoryl-undecaprenol N-acetylglucosamine transferase [Candidatus Paceibacterota bacterium]|nr:UDP-N-acetylglucosamine--N-acetylmuramyl-(pentapeptide) pyrophosphoryl-undecaprenol N-acetylglucosamine transferase [Candidatus Paceibacterota bacterium]
MCRNIAISICGRDKLFMMRILIVGGGTGGHFYPLLAVAESLTEQSPKLDLYYMGPEPYNLPMLQAQDIKFIYCPAGKLRLYPSIQNFFDFFRNIAGVFVALVKLFWLYPDVIFSKGGYTSVPVLLAARFLRIPVVIHDSDTVPGRASLLAKNFARYVAVSYPEAAKFFPVNKTALIGIPLRSEVTAPISDPFSVLGITNDLPLIYVTGGSSGAERLNDIVLRCLDELLPNYRIFHQVGSGKKAQLVVTAQRLISNTNLQNRYFIAEHLDGHTVNALLTAAQIVISRAGSTTIFEIATHGKPSIIIPIPENISRDQRTNAYAYAKTGAASVLEEENLTETLLTTEINSIITNPARYTEMSTAAKAFASTDAAAKIAQILLKVGTEH